MQTPHCLRGLTIKLTSENKSICLNLLQLWIWEQVTSWGGWPHYPKVTTMN